MSGQFPGNYNNPVGGHIGNFGNQMINMNIVQNQSGMVGWDPQTLMAQKRHGQLQGANMGLGTTGIGHGAAGMHSPSNAQQQTNPQALAQQHQIQQQQPQLTLQTPSTPSTGASMGVPATMQPTPQQQGMLSSGQKEINPINLTRLGQETVQDITMRFQEIFSALKTIQPTSGNRENSTEKKVQEYFRTIRLLFKRIRIIYEKSNDGCSQGMEFTHVESLIPYKDEPDHRTDTSQCEEYKKALQENRELIETVMLKNKQLREIIDRTRIIIWEINTMLSMRRS
ncbi:unnamed protein product [Hermetia illucens]|uniref:Mediator of RNA polymerase II transcription subunit 30 n=2 Tax=Hermetia illucens TaxID=343691 RepID=A0A7R8V5X5_HERIL|nr:unnamed protein product [Hermetia illucens]